MNKNRYLERRYVGVFMRKSLYSDQGLATSFCIEMRMEMGSEFQILVKFIWILFCVGKKNWVLFLC